MCIFIRGILSQKGFLKRFGKACVTDRCDSTAFVSDRRTERFLGAGKRKKGRRAFAAVSESAHGIVRRILCENQKPRTIGAQGFGHGIVSDGQPSRTLTGSMTETVPPHGVKLYRCFGKTALMRRRYDIGSAVIGAQGDDVQFRHVYAPSNGVYRLTVEATGVYDLQVNGLAYGKGLKDLSETAVPLCLSENFIRLVRVTGADVKAISIK